MKSYNGKHWSVIPSPNANAFSNELDDVACVSASACVAVGNANLDSEDATWRTLIEMWNGTTWSVAASPSPSGSKDALEGVSCAAANRCVAVGSSINSSGYFQTLAESWDGMHWTTTATIDVSTQDNTLGSVACVSASWCIAVGHYDLEGTGDNQTLAEQWNGSAWSLSTTTNPISGDDYLGDVSCTSSSRCVAIGGGIGTGLIESWNGTTWTTDTDAGPPGASPMLRSVACSTAAQCVVVGDATDKLSNLSSNFVERWDGSAWSITPSANIVGEGDTLDAVTCPAGSACVAAGQAATQGAAVLAYAAKLTSVPSPPTITALLAGDGWASVVWNGPSDTGGSPITLYTVETVRLDTGTASYTTVPSGATRAVVSGLHDNAIRGYSFQVLASTSKGNGSPTPGSFLFVPLAGPLDVTTHWDTSELPRLQQSAAYLGVTTTQLQHDAVRDARLSPRAQPAERYHATYKSGLGFGPNERHDDLANRGSALPRRDSTPVRADARRNPEVCRPTSRLPAQPRRPLATTRKTHTNVPAAYLLVRAPRPSA